MRAVVQRVKEASVKVNAETVGRIGPGLLILLGVGTEDTPRDSETLAEKIAHLRIFADEKGLMNRSLLESGGSALVVSQFTLWGDCSKGRRPSFVRAARPETARDLYERFVSAMQARGVATATGRFQEEMAVHLVNDGPVTLILESAKVP